MAELSEAVHGMINEDLRGRVEPFDATAAALYAAIVPGRERLGRPIDMADAQIASMCRELQATLATRNARDFEDTGINVVDPWNPR
jgi:toxin FitB